MIWHGRWAPFPRGRNFTDMVQNSFLQYVYFCIPPKTFFNIVNFVGINTIENLHFPLISLQISKYRYLYLPTFWYLHIFCLGMLGIDSGWKNMAWQMNPLIFDWRLQWHFSQMDTTLRIWHSTNWHLCHMFDYFFILQSLSQRSWCIIWYSSHIYQYFTKCDICQLNSYLT